MSDKKTVCIQVGHWQIESITSENLRSWRSPSILSRSTGASGERDYHWNEIMPRLRDKLINAGVVVYIAGSTYQPEIYEREYDLWISLHYDGGGTGERCMIAAPNRATQPPYLHEQAFSDSERFAAVWKQTYPEIVGVPNRDEFITAGMVDYYAFDYVGYDTPSVIVEHFNHTSPRGTYLKENPELVAEGDYQAIIKFLGLQDVIHDDKYRIVYKGEVLAEYDYNPEDKLKECQAKCEQLQKTISDQTLEIAQLETALQEQEADNAQLAADIRRITRERDDCLAEKKSLEAEIEDLNKQIDALNQEIGNLNQVINEQQATIEKLKAGECLDAYSGWELIRLGVAKLVGRNKSHTG